jgi:hypothetical protein
LRDRRGEAIAAAESVMWPNIRARQKVDYTSWLGYLGAVKQADLFTDIHKLARCRMNRTKKLILSLLAAGILGLGATAQAQDTPPPSEPPPPPPPTHRSSSSGDGAGLGIGATVPLSGSPFPVANVVYDTSLFHLEGLLGFTSTPAGPDDRNSNWVFGAGGWYHLHKGISSDLSVGGVVAINYQSMPTGSNTFTAIEPGINARAFATPNFALFFRGGLSFVLGNDDGVEFYFGGQPVILGGFTYFLR